MAKDAKIHAKARALYEAGESFEKIAPKVGASVRSLKSWCKKEGWIKGEAAPKLHEKEAKALEQERERLGLSKARVQAKIASRFEAKMAVRVTDSGAFSTVPLPSGIEVDEDGKADFGGERLRVTDDVRTQDKALDQAIAVLGMAKVQVEASDDLRALFQSMRPA
jgi:hypothetical protein